MTSSSSIIHRPDTHGRGLTDQPLDALRYDRQTDHPREVAGILRAMMPNRVKVLDVGCGTGSVTLIANRGHHNCVIALEPDPARAAVARERGIDVHERLLEIEFIEEHGLFDVVLSSDVVEHVPAPHEFLAQMRAALKPGGLLLISVPNVAHWTVRLNLLAGRFNYTDTGIMDSTHLRWFTERSIRSLIVAAGFEVLEIAQTAGVELSVYMRGKLRHIPRKLRDPIIRAATSASPRLFGVQHVIKARSK